jgi:hypothetical protein
MENNNGCTKQENESQEDYLKRLLIEGDKCIDNLQKTFSNMEKNGIIKFCSKCGCEIYKNKIHKCK